METLSSGIAQAVQVYSKDTKAWFEDEDEAWVSASVISKEESATGVKILFQDDKDDGRVRRKAIAKIKIYFLPTFICSNMCLKALSLYWSNKKGPNYHHFVTHHDLKIPRI